MISWERFGDSPDFMRTYAVDDPDAVNCDLLIGEVDFAHRGLGGPMLRRFLREVVFSDPRFTTCIIDPQPENASAIRAYEKAGFCHVRTMPDDGEGNAVYLMKLRRADLVSASKWADSGIRTSRWLSSPIHVSPLLGGSVLRIVSRLHGTFPSALDRGNARRGHAGWRPDADARARIVRPHARGADPLGDRGGASGRAKPVREARATSWYFYGCALLHVVAAHLVGTLALVVMGRYTAEHLLYLPLMPEQMAIAVLAPLGEEYGWRGYALPRLQSVMKPLPASLVIGVVWTLWHLPTAFMPGDSIAHVFLTLPAMLAGSVLYTWMYNATGGSMRIVLLAHLGVHLDNVFRAAASTDGPAPFVATSIVLVTFAAGLVAAGALRRDTAVTVELARAPA